MALTILASLLIISRAGTCTITSFPSDNSNPSSPDEYVDPQETSTYVVDTSTITCETKGEPNSLAFVKINVIKDYTSQKVMNICRVDV